MADLTRAILYHCLVPGWELFAIRIPIIIKTTAQTIAAMSSTVSQYIMTSKYYSLPLRICGHLSPNLCSRYQHDDNSGLAFAFLLTALAFLTLISIGRVISSHPPRRTHPDTIRLHALERAITRQIEINYHLTGASQNRKLQNPNCNTAEFEKWALHWSDIKRFRDQAEADFKHGAPTCYNDDLTDCARRYRELRNELARLHSLGRNIVNAREEARRYCGSIASGTNGMIGDGAGGMIRKADALEAARADKMDNSGRSAFGMRKAPRKRAVFQQQVDVIGRLTPGGRFG
jgi:hypothetical protein